MSGHLRNNVSVYQQRRVNEKANVAVLIYLSSGSAASSRGLHGRGGRRLYLKRRKADACVRNSGGIRNTSPTPAYLCYRYLSRYFCLFEAQK